MVSVEDSASLEITQALPAEAKKYLSELFLRLRDIEGTAVVSAHALRAEEGWVGMCVSRELRTHVSDRLSLEIERGLERFGLHVPTHREIEG